MAKPGAGEPQPTPAERLSAVEANFFRALNEVLEPVVRRGWGSLLLPTGLIVLETTGRRSGRRFQVPVVATRIGDSILATTVRADRSQWLKNLAATPASRYWELGRLHDAQAVVLSPDTNIPDPARVPTLIRPLLPALSLLAAGCGAGFAILSPRETLLSPREALSTPREAT